MFVFLHDIIREVYNNVTRISKHQLMLIVSQLGHLPLKYRLIALQAKEIYQLSQCFEYMEPVQCARAYDLFSSYKYQLSMSPQTEQSVHFPSRKYIESCTSLSPWASSFIMMDLSSLSNITLHARLFKESSCVKWSCIQMIKDH